MRGEICLKRDDGDGEISRKRDKGEGEISRKRGTKGRGK